MPAMGSGRRGIGDDGSRRRYVTDIGERGYKAIAAGNPAGVADENGDGQQDAKNVETGTDTAISCEYLAECLATLEP
ncbi:hypothetical protein [Sphingomonas sp. DBB INV C78]|uniref:hypothetical protein n=1 Tax=Sphingomonas sp. DBB INV C78 TaxID=3349434 RepID=UPI0036D41924